jgi:hypothetical protein
MGWLIVNSSPSLETVWSSMVTEPAAQRTITPWLVEMPKRVQQESTASHAYTK